MCDSLLEGLDDAFFCLLLVLLPNIQELNFWDPSSHIVSATIWRIVDVVAQAQNVGKEGFALSHLKTVQLHCVESGVDLDFAIPFAGIPSVRTLCVREVRGSSVAATAPGNAADDHDELKTCSVWPRASGLSQVETLELDCSKISSRTIELLLPAFKNLRRFKYGNAGSLFDGETYKPQNVVKAHLKYHAHS
jgi:hypothetical protein